MAERALYRGEPSVERTEIQKNQDEEEKRVKEEKRIKTRYGELRKHDKGVPWCCDCSAQILVTTSHDPNTRGEKFLSCFYEIADGRGQGCGFRRWWIPACQDEFIKIRDEKNEMKDELDKVAKRTDEHIGLIFELEMKYQEMEKKYQEMEKKYEELAMKYERLNQYL